jgi:hypothetical protein
MCPVVGAHIRHTPGQIRVRSPSQVELREHQQKDSNMRKSTRTLLALTAVASMSAAACGSSDSDTPDEPATSDVTEEETEEETESTEAPVVTEAE